MARCNRTVRQHTRNPRYDDPTNHIFKIEAYKMFVQFRKITTKMHADVENLVDSPQPRIRDQHESRESLVL